MHLKQLKLAGFKSFVDPTVVYFPSQLVAIVGPNGCGKSNIIDAVRWVMGESSARHLRGESMVDVIFNGSSLRKALGQASVELIFDNSLGRLAGPFASYAEIAVKRVVTREGDSAYYLNGSRCRRKDITDIFLGTGAGARGYSIIGQGTISQLIEARPEDLRVYLEEAAGVSKYKERRKETLQRITHTRDNLERVADICEELDKQLQRLERQASAAQRYLVLKEEEKLCRSQILMLKWQDLSQQRALKNTAIQELALKQDALQSQLTKQHTQKITINEACFTLDESTQLMQKDFYQLGVEIARLEESIQQQQREKKRLEQEEQHIQNDWQAVQKQLSEDSAQLNQSEQQWTVSETRWQHAKDSMHQKEDHLHEVQGQKNTWDEQWQTIQDHKAHLHQEQQTLRLKTEHLQQQQQQGILRLEKLQDEKEGMSLDFLQETKQKLEVEQTLLAEAHQKEEEKLQLCQRAMETLRSRLQETEQRLHGLQDTFHQKNTELAALSATQKAASALVQQEIEGFSENARVMDVLQVDAPWQLAMEMVLAESLQAYVMTDLNEIWSFEAQCTQHGAYFLKMSAKKAVSAVYPCLLDKIQGDIPAQSLVLESIFTAKDNAEALDWLPHIAPHQSIITPEGVWFSQNWLRFSKKAVQNEQGFLARQQGIQELTVVVTDLDKQLSALKSLRDEAHEALQDNTQTLQDLQRQVKIAHDALNSHQNVLHEKTQGLLHARQRETSLLAEMDELQCTLTELAYEKEEFLQQQHTLEEAMHEALLRYEDGVIQHQKWQSLLQEVYKEQELSRQILHETELVKVHEKNKIQQLQTGIAQKEEQLQRLEDRLEHVLLLRTQGDEPTSQLQEQLQSKLRIHQHSEQQLRALQRQKEELQAQVASLEKTILQEEETQKQLQTQTNALRLEINALEVRSGSFLEALDEMKMEIKSLLETLPVGETLSTREDNLLAILDKIKRLGAINLAAIEEFNSEAQRKKYLDEQRFDLMQALNALEQAIEKMDQETKERLLHTFTQVNASFKALFPKLFGGGKAQLELTCENLLEAGIVVMAQPPGKRNSTIHLLSGGEKAMTAVALVFAIFQLNPSPFCMLDEVDAPLDDVNVGRFCTLVKEMSKFVQFLFITHNKVTMELADHLMGVTMREPGVSRLVAVDVTQALAME